MLQGKIALVTGAGRGLGREIALGLAGAGAHVLLHGRRAEPLQATAAAIAALGGTSAPVIFDLEDGETLRAAPGACGPVDLLVNTAVPRDRRPIGQPDRPTARPELEVMQVVPLDYARTVEVGMGAGGE